MRDVTDEFSILEEVSWFKRLGDTEAYEVVLGLRPFTNIAPVAGLFLPIRISTNVAASCSATSRS